MSVYNISGGIADNSVYSIEGTRLSQAYDINGNPLISEQTGTVETVPNQISGTESGYSLWLTNPGYSYPLYDFMNFLSEGNDFQSLGYDSDNDEFYRFGTSATVIVYNSNLQKIRTITLPNVVGHGGEVGGHKNDNAYYNGKFYLVDVPAEELNDIIYEWDIETNTITPLPIIGVPLATTAPMRINEAVCNVPGKPGYLYLIYADFQNSDLIHYPGDKLGIYEYNISTHVAELVAEWERGDCVYFQGAEICDGILYIACNSPTITHPSNYTGITLQAFRTDTWERLPSLYLSGNIEPEGMLKYPYGNIPTLTMGIAHWATLAKSVKFSAPYRLVQN